jgi:hypothetical protein
LPTPGRTTDQLARVLAAHDQPGVQEQVHAAGDEGVELIVVDDVDPHLVGAEASRLEDRGAVGAQDRLDLGVADQADAARLDRRDLEDHPGRQGQDQPQASHGCHPHGVSVHSRKRSRLRPGCLAEPGRL